MTKENYIVIEGSHKDPNNYNTMHNSSRKVYGPLSETKAKELAMMLNQKNVDNFNHRAWVIKDSIKLNEICEQCQKSDHSVIQNLFMYGFKICKSCNLAKNIFPI